MQVGQATGCRCTYDDMKRSRWLMGWWTVFLMFLQVDGAYEGEEAERAQRKGHGDCTSVHSISMPSFWLGFRLLALPCLWPHTLHSRFLSQPQLKKSISRHPCMAHVHTSYLLSFAHVWALAKLSLSLSHTHTDQSVPFHLVMYDCIQPLCRFHVLSSSHSNILDSYCYFPLPFYVLPSTLSRQIVP